MTFKKNNRSTQVEKKVEYNMVDLYLKHNSIQFDFICIAHLILTDIVSKQLHRNVKNLIIISFKMNSFHLKFNLDLSLMNKPEAMENTP